MNMESPGAWVGPRPQELDWTDLYLRLSVTDACNFRCAYCRPVPESHEAEDPAFLSFEEIVRLIGWTYEKGSRKVRLTGGEPLLRKNLPDLVARIKSAYPDVNLSLSTNGLTLPPIAKDFAQAGLDRINISLDTLDREKFKDLTGVDALDKVLDAIDASIESGLAPVKLNVVLLRDVNENELADLVRFALARGVYIRFIEYMPHCKTETNQFEIFSSAEARGILSRDFVLTPVEDHERPVGSGPAKYWRVEGSDLPIGLISSVSEDICRNCSRLRMTARGELVRCIQLDHYVNTHDLIREGKKEEFLGILESAYSCRDQKRPEGHTFFLGMQLVQTGG